jgi:hypothetical protein
VIILSNKLRKHEEDIARMLADVSYFMHREVVKYIQSKNIEQYEIFDNLFKGKININDYLYQNSACVFPGTRRYTSKEKVTRKYSDLRKAIIDDNVFPRYIWCFLVLGKSYSGANWKKNNLAEFELAHIFAHKETETDLEKMYFDTFEDKKPFGSFSCACNTLLIPKGMVRPTDNSQIIKVILFKRYIDLYGESPLNGRKSFKHDEVPKWYDKLQWNITEPPRDWKKNIDELINKRTAMIKNIMLQSETL